jgi:succinate dehydrogenase / fumarate reductase iron-sulfur subunit
MKLHLKIWRQKGPTDQGQFENHTIDGIIPDMSFLEMMDVLNVKLASEGKQTIAFDHDCREGICGSCSMMINGRAHGPTRGTTCQTYMRNFRDGQTIVIEPWRAMAFPVMCDLVVDRSSFDRIQQAGGYVSVNVGGAPDGNSIPVSKVNADLAMDAAQCIGCGACVAACKNASAMLFVAAKVGHLGLLPQGEAEARDRVKKMVSRMDAEGFGNCTNHYECEAVCPKEISADFISKMNRDYLGATVFPKPM